MRSFGSRCSLFFNNLLLFRAIYSLSFDDGEHLLYCIALHNMVLSQFVLDLQQNDSHIFQIYDWKKIEHGSECSKGYAQLARNVQI